MITYIHQPNRRLRVFHAPYLNVEHSGYTGIIVSYKDRCITCEPQMFHIEEGDVDLVIEIIDNGPDA